MDQAAVYKAEGVILKRKNTGETDRIVTIFTRQYGKIRTIAKGIRKISSRRAPYLEIFSRVSLVIRSGKTLDAINEVDSIEDFPGIRKDLKKISLGYLICELTEALLPERQEYHEVYTLLVKTLSALNAQNSKKLGRIGRTFTLELLWELGFLPRGEILTGSSLQNFIENLTEKNLRSPKLIRLMFSE